MKIKAVCDPVPNLSTRESISFLTSYKVSIMVLAWLWPVPTTIFMLVEVWLGDSKSQIITVSVLAIGSKTDKPIFLKSIERLNKSMDLKVSYLDQMTVPALDQKLLKSKCDFRPLLWQKKWIVGKTFCGHFYDLEYRAIFRLIYQ